MYGKGIANGLWVTFKHFFNTYVDDIRYAGRKYLRQENFQVRQGLKSQGAFTVAPGVGGSKEVGNGRDFGELLGGVDPASLPPGVRARLRDEARPRTPRMELGEFMSLTRAKAVQR